METRLRLFERLARNVDDLLPSPRTEQSDAYIDACEAVKQFSDNELDQLLAKPNAEQLSQIILEHALRTYEDAEADRDRAAVRTDRILIVIGVIAGFAFASADDLTLWHAGSTASLGISAAIACIARRGTRIVGPTAPLSLMETAAKPEVDSEARLKCLASLQLHRSFESILWANEWTNRMLSLATAFLIAAFGFLVLATLATVL